MSKATVDPNALMMRNADMRKAKKEAELDARVASAADRLGPGRIKKRPDSTESQAAADQAAPKVAESSEQKNPTEAPQPAREEKRTTVDIPVDLIREIEKVLFDRKMRGEKTTFKEFLNNALKAAVEEERGK